MANAPKTHKLTLGKHTEEVTAEELANLQKALPARAFSQYEVSELQPTKPADLPAKEKAETKAEDKKK